MNIAKLFEARKGDSAFNTSYPLHPAHWQAYRVAGEADFSHETALSFYVHIPFCTHLCTFCEYARMLTPAEEAQTAYVAALERDIQAFTERYPARTLLGFDIGGGTPTALSTPLLARLLRLYARTAQGMTRAEGYEPSIEATFPTLTPEKARLIREAGIRRISLGLQSSVCSVQRANARVNPTLRRVAAGLEMLHSAGLEKVNLDFMYGLQRQTLADIRADISCIRALRPEQVTLYELRTNQLTTRHTPDSEQLYASYSLLYEALVALGYHARFGQNTFSLDAHDEGLSSYLRERMLRFAPYRGFGLSAQSVSSTEVSYNCGKLATDIAPMLHAAHHPAAYTYRLPASERMAKYVAVSGYFGRFSTVTASRLLGADFGQAFRHELAFCLAEGLLTLEDDTVALTPKGFRHYGAVFSLFYYRQR